MPLYRRRRIDVSDSLPWGQLSGTVAAAVQRGADRRWSLDDLAWSALRPERLTERDRDVVRFLTYIEDHLPGYLTWLMELFPVTDERLPVDEYCVNREYFRFLVTWAADEERHAAALTRYQVAAGMADAGELARALAVEGRKPFTLPYEHPLQAFTYTMVQEKATQLFYQRFRATATEPLLRDLLHRLARDEARHFAFYAQLVEAYLRRDAALSVPHLTEVLRTFRMPLADTLTGYWRWSLRVADAVGYDHTEAYGALVRLVSEAGDSRGGVDLGDFVTAVRRLP
jgi:hypothetical protein